MIEFCAKRKLPITATKDSPYSTDANMLGLTHEAGKLESLETPPSFIKPGMGVHATAARDTPEEVEIEFVHGVPTSINGEKVNVLDSILKANSIGGPHGVGIATHLVENRFVGIKSRGVYEAPGMELLGSAYSFLLELVLDRRARELFDMLSRTVSKQIYQGFWYDPCTQMALRGIERSAELVTGKVRVSLYRGTVRFAGAKDVPHSLYSEENASMEAIGVYNHADSEGLLSILGVSAKVLSRANQVIEKL